MQGIQDEKSKIKEDQKKMNDFNHQNSDLKEIWAMI
jgi:hypothetical protein